MKFLKKIEIFIKASPSKKIEYMTRISKKIHTYFLPLLRIHRILFSSKGEKRNAALDILERFSNIGKFIRYRNYFGYKLFYSCSRNGTGIINHIMCGRTYEQETCDFIKKSLDNVENPGFVDIGANIGLISIYMLKKIPKIKIYAFEPSPHQNMLFEKTIKENYLEDKIKLFKVALGEEDGEATFFAHNSANCSGDGFKDTGRGGNTKEIKVETTSLDSWCNKNNSPKIDLIKIDTEGAELYILMGAKEAIIKNSPIIFFEMQEVNYKVYGYNWVDILNFFNTVGYSIYTE